MKRRSFLVVENDEVLRDLYRFLIDSNYDDSCIDCTANGSEALEKAAERDYTVILSDIEMPVMNGIEFHKKLKELHPHLAERVAYISAHLYNPYFAYIIDENLPYLAKPFVKKDFYVMIDGVIEKVEKNGAAEHALEGKRRHVRFKTNSKCILEPFGDDQIEEDERTAHSIVGETIDYSEGGLGVVYRGDKISEDITLNVIVESLNIFDRKAKIVWSTPNGSCKAGLQWL